MRIGIGRKFGRNVAAIHSGIAACLIVAMLVTACDVLGPEPTPTPTFPILAASPTVNPLAPVGDEDALDAIAAMGTRIAAYTPAAGELAPDGSTLTPTPLPTEASYRMSFAMIDGLSLAATFLGAARRPAPTVILLHDAPGNREDWITFAAQLQRAGVNAMMVDLRGYGDTGGTIDLSKAVSDMQSLYARLSTLPGIDPARISFMGAGLGANLAIAACAVISGCRSAAVISPQPDAAGINASDMMAAYGRRPILLAGARAEGNSAAVAEVLEKLAQGDKRLLLYDGDQRGVRLLEAQPTLSEIVIRWFGGEIR